MTRSIPLKKPRRVDLSDAADLKRRVMAEIATHVETHGRKDWDLIREKFEYAHVIGKAAGPSGKRKFTRWVKAVCEPRAVDKTRPHEGRDVSQQALQRATKRARAAGEKLGFVPSPAYMLRAGAEAENHVDFLAGLHELWADANQLRDKAYVEDATAPEGYRLKVGVMSTSIKRRVDVINLGVKVMREVYDLEEQIRFYDVIVDIILTELDPHPETQRRVIERLEELNQRRGVTANARMNGR
jgi:hypothetical protein